MLPSCLIGCGYMTEYGHGPACMLYAETHPDTKLAATLHVLPCAGCTMERLTASAGQRICICMCLRKKVQHLMVLDFWYVWGSESYC